MNNKTIKMALGVIGVGAIAYYFYKKNKDKKDTMTTTTKVVSFAGGDDGFFNLTAGGTKTRPKWVAGGYTVNNAHPRGATWMALSTDGSLGYWVEGYVPSGTISYELGQQGGF